MSFSEPLVWRGTSGRSRATKELGFVGVQAFEQAIEGGPAGAPLEGCDRSAGAIWDLAPRRGIGLIEFEIAIVVPDQAPQLVLGGAVAIGEGFKLVNQPLGVNPAQSVTADGELAGNHRSRRRH